MDRPASAPKAGSLISDLCVMTLDVSDEETAALARLLSKTIDDDRYPLSPRRNRRGAR
jgi:hypothetical protein